MTDLIAPSSVLDPRLARVWHLLKPQTRFFLSKTIRHPQFEKALEAIAETHAMTGTQGTGMILTGMPGTGKTTILKRYVKTSLEVRDDIESDTLTKLPIIRVVIPPKPTIISLIKTILYKVDHIAPKGTEADLRERLAVLVDEQEVELIIFDEFQHLLREQAQISTRNVLNFIKVFMDECNLAVIMAGLPKGYDAISEFEELDERLSFEQFHLQPLALIDGVLSTDFTEYMATCERILEDAGVKTVSLSSETMLKRIHLATQGKVRLISRLFIKVLQNSDLSSRLVLEDYARAYDRARLNRKLGAFNPFRAQNNKVLEKLKKLEVMV